MDRADEFVPEAWNRVKTAYTVYRQSTWEARLRYANQQWLTWDSDRKMFRREVPNDPFVPMPNINRFGPWIDGIASNFSNVPEIEAVPVPIDDPVSMGVADVCNVLCDHAIKDNALRSDYGSREDRSNTARQMFTLGGCVFSRVRLEQKPIGQREVTAMQPTSSVQCLACGQQYPDLLQAPAACPGCNSPQITVEQSESLMPQMGEDGQPMTEPVTQPRVIVEIEDPVWFSPRPGATSMDNTNWLFCGRRMSIDEIFERTGLEATPDGEYPDGFNTTFQNELVYWYLGYAAPQESNNESCLFVEFWCEPGKKKEFPEGCYATYFNGKVQSAQPWSELGPIDNPITKGDMQALPGIFFPRASSFDLCDIQQQLSRLDSMIELHMKTSAVEPIVIDENTICSEISGRADKIVRWRSVGPGSKEPHRMEHGSLDPELYNRVKYLEQKGESIAATVSVFRGEQPGSITAASAISQLRGQAEMQFATPVKNWNNFWKETIRKVICFYQKYELSELVKIVGQDKISQINDFIHADLKTCVEFIATSNGLPRTRDERRQEMMVLFDKGALDVKDPQVQQKLFELFGDTGMMENFNLDATRARYNIRLAKEQGKTPQFRAGIDDPDIHLALAVDAAKAMDFDQWKPESQRALLAYIQSIKTVQAANTPPPPPNPLQVKAMETESREKIARFQGDVSVTVAEIGAKVKENADQLAAFMAQMDRAFQLVQGGGDRSAANPQPQPPPVPAGVPQGAAHV